MYGRSVQEEYDEKRRDIGIARRVPGGAYQREEMLFSVIEDNYHYLTSKGWDLSRDYEESVEASTKALTHKRYFNKSLGWIEEKVKKEKEKGV